MCSMVNKKNRPQTILLILKAYVIITRNAIIIIVIPRGKIPLFLFSYQVAHCIAISLWCGVTFHH